MLALQQGLYGKQLLPRLERLVSEDADFAELGAVHHTAETHGLVELARTMGPWDVYLMDTKKESTKSTNYGKWQIDTPPMLYQFLS